MNDLGIDLNRSRFFELKEKRKVIRKFRKRLLRRHYIYIYIYNEKYKIHKIYMYTRYYIQRNFILAIRCSLHIGTWTVRLFILILSRLRKQSQRMKDAILRDALAVVNFDNIDKLLNNTLMEHRNCHRVQEAYLVIFYYERYWKYLPLRGGF